MLTGCLHPLYLACMVMHKYASGIVITVTLKRSFASWNVYYLSPQCVWLCPALYMQIILHSAFTITSGRPRTVLYHLSS